MCVKEITHMIINHKFRTLHSTNTIYAKKFFLII